MGYDGEKLLIACKNSGDVDDNEVDGKAVYSFDLSEKKVSEKEAFSITEDELDAFIKDRKYFDNVKDFDPSGIAVHPITGDIYLLSADHVLVVFTKICDFSYFHTGAHRAVGGGRRGQEGQKR